MLILENTNNVKANMCNVLIFGQEYADWSFQTDVQTTELLLCHNMFMESHFIN